MAHDLANIGFVQDVFGHIYSGDVPKAYKVVAYLVQGTGTASLPKAQIRANWETLRSVASPELAHLCGTTHDEQEARMALQLGTETIIATLQEMMENMTTKFSHKFDNIPLRAKLYLSKTTAADAEEFNIDDYERIGAFIES